MLQRPTSLETKSGRPRPSIAVLFHSLTRTTHVWKMSTDSSSTDRKSATASRRYGPSSLSSSCQSWNSNVATRYAKSPSRPIGIIRLTSEISPQLRETHPIGDKYTRWKSIRNGHNQRRGKRRRQRYVNWVHISTCRLLNGRPVVEAAKQWSKLDGNWCKARGISLCACDKVAGAGDTPRMLCIYHLLSEPRPFRLSAPRDQSKSEPRRGRSNSPTAKKKSIAMRPTVCLTWLRLRLFPPPRFDYSKLSRWH